MKVMFDHNTPWTLQRYLKHHEGVAAEQMVWERVRNGDLLKLAEDSGFEVFVTCDQEIKCQQNLTTRKIAIVEIRKNNWPSLEPIVQDIVAAVDNATPRSYKTIDCVYIHKSQRKT